MNLQEYLDAKGITAAEFGRRIGVQSRATVRRYVAGGRIPDPQIMTRIINETEGEVMPNDFFDTGEAA